MSVKLLHGDALEVLRTLPDCSVDAIVTDPPAGISFMGKQWDTDHGGRDNWIAAFAEIARECLRVVKPGGHALVWAIPRTSHWTATAWENGGWQVRDRIAHVFGSGFPKSSRVNRSPMFCQCGEVGRNGVDTARVQSQDDHNGKGLVSFGDGLPRADVHHSMNTPLDSQGDCLPDCDFGDGRVHHQQAGDQASALQQGCVQGHSHSHGRGDVRAGALEHTLYPARHSDHLSSQGYLNHDCSGSQGGCDTRGNTPDHPQTNSDSAQSNGHKSHTGELLSALPHCTTCGKPVANGWGSALKPAMEDWWLLRKPLTGTIAANVMQWGVGALNVDGCRVAGEAWKAHRATGLGSVKFFTEGDTPEIDKAPHASGRWPSHLIHDGSNEVLAMFPQTTSGVHTGNYQRTTSKTKNAYGERLAAAETRAGDTGSAARFFYCAKSSKRDRDEGLPEGMRNMHPTVKSVELCRYLCRLITPAGGVVLDPFMGSGSTGKGAVLEGFDFIGIDKESDYLEIAKARIAWAEQQVRQLSLEVKP